MIKFEIMDSLTLKTLFNHRKLPFHVAVAGLSTLVPAILILSGNKFNGIDFGRMAALLFVQLEVFLLIARIIFTELRPGIPVRELTRTVLERFLVFMVLCFVAALLINLIFIAFLDIISGDDSLGSVSIFFNRDFGSWTRSTMAGLAFGAGIFIFIQWQEALKREQKLREENLIFLNQTLRNQVNPHFLFNSLNTLSALIPERPDAAERFILKLSAIYRYILENSSRDFVTLESELGFISDYYYLHSIRDDGKIRLSIDAAGVERYNILPVSLQILVENAIKHNSATRENPLVISITIEDDMIVVRNNLQKMGAKVKSTGIGLQNLRERTWLSTGKALVVEESQNEFIVKMPLL